VEADANRRLLQLLPEEMREEYDRILNPDGEAEEERKLVKAADKLSAYIKCIEERKAGNLEFMSAEKSALEAIRAMDLPEAEVFLEEFLPPYEKTLDEIRP
jgi:5'-deoxynucleotidase